MADSILAPFLKAALAQQAIGMAIMHGKGGSPKGLMGGRAQALGAEAYLFAHLARGPEGVNTTQVLWLLAKNEYPGLRKADIHFRNPIRRPPKLNG